MPVHQAQSKAKMCIGSKKIKEAYIGNKLVYSSEKEVNVAKNAPPFLSAGWRTMISRRWVATGYENGVTTYYIEAQDDGTRWISENEINVLNWIQEDEQKKGYLVYLPTPIDTSKYSRFGFDVDNAADDDTSEGRVFPYFFECCRFSQDGVTWHPYWEARDTFDKSYKYAQVGYFSGGDNDAMVPMWVSTHITRFVIQ